MNNFNYIKTKNFHSSKNTLDEKDKPQTVIKHCNICNQQRMDSWNLWVNKKKMIEKNGQKISLIFNWKEKYEWPIYIWKYSQPY